MRECRYKDRPSVCESIEPAYRYDRWEKINILSALSHIIAHLRCLDSDSEASSTSGEPTLLLDKLTDDCSQHFEPQRLVFVLIVFHTALFPCNVGPFGTERRDTPALVDQIAVAAFIKKPLEHGFRHSAQLSAFALTVCRLSNLDRKQHACVKQSILSTQFDFSKQSILSTQLYFSNC